MDVHKLQVKLYVAEPGALSPRDFVPALHGWIQRRALDEIAIDVADYGHVHNGPGALLVCDAANYGVDLGDGRLGLLYTRKRPLPGPPAERVRAALAAALRAALLLEEAPPMAGAARFRGDELLVRVNDRLFANDDAAAERLRPALAASLDRLYGPDGYTLAREGAPRELLSVRARATAAVSMADLLARL